MLEVVPEPRGVYQVRVEPEELQTVGLQVFEILKHYDVVTDRRPASVFEGAHRTLHVHLPEASVYPVRCSSRFCVEADSMTVRLPASIVLGLGRLHQVRHFEVLD